VFVVLCATLGVAEHTCPSDKLQDAYRISHSQKDAHYGHCSHICLSPGLKKVAGNHGVQYGSTCQEQGCTEYAGSDSKAGQHFFLYKCPDAVIQQYMTSPSPPPPPSPPPSPPAPRSPPPSPAPPPWTGDGPPFVVKYTDMACGNLLSPKVPSLRECSARAKAKGHQFFAYNKWWKFCLACSAEDVGQCEEPLPDATGCHYQVGFAVYHQHMGAGSDDEEAFDDVAGDADIITDGEEGVDTEAMGDDAYGLYARRESILRAHPAGQPLPRTGTVGLVAFLVLVAGVAALGALLRGPLALMRHPQPTPVQRLSHML